MKEPPQQGGGVYYYPLHFTGKETEAQKSEATYLRSSASTWQEEGKVPTLGVSPTGESGWSKPLCLGRNERVAFKFWEWGKKMNE